jgi:hypothetical protein
MTKTTLALAAALLAGTTLTSAANAGGIRVGFGFPLGSFVAHSNQSYSGGGYDRHCAKERRPRRIYQAEAAPVRKIKRPRKIDVASVKPVSAPVKTAKLEDKLASDPATTTDIAKTSDVTTGSTAAASPAPAAPATTTTPATITPAKTTTDTAKTDTTKTDKVAIVDKTPTDEKVDLKKATSEAKQICRRYSAAIAGLIDVPCNE